jgi:iron complex transport system substrate-binding protein
VSTKGRVAALAILLGLALAWLSTASIAASSSAPITIVDDLGRKVTVGSSERIVAIGPSVTETLYALGLGDRVVGVDLYSDYPPEAVAKQKVSSWWTPDPEEVVALKPDVVFYSVGNPAALETLERAGLTVVALRPRTIDDIFRDIRLIGNITGKPQEAEALATSLSRRVDDVKERTQNVTVRPRVYMETWYPPPWTWGPGSWGHQMIELAGGRNAFEDAKTAFVQTTDEEVIARRPDAIVSLVGAMHRVTLEDFKSRPGWSDIPALAKGAVYLLDENLFVRPGPRIVEGLEELARILHPELFGGASVHTFPIAAAELKLGVRTLNVSGPMEVNLMLIKAAADGTLTVTLTKAGPEAPADRRLVGYYVDLRCSAPEGLALILRLHYREDWLKEARVEEGSLRIYAWDEGGRRWVPLSSALNEAGNYVEATVMHLSYFALMGKPAPPPPPPWASPVPLWVAVTSIAAGAVAAGVVGALAVRKAIKRGGPAR